MKAIEPRTRQGGQNLKSKALWLYPRQADS
jgi:hypothetical protein